MFDLGYFLSSIPLLLKFLYLTVTIAILSMAIGLVIGLVLETLIRRNVAVLAGAARAYISFFRATPLLVQLFILYYGMPQVIPAMNGMNAYTATVVGISLNCGAYLAEIIRGAIRAVDVGQWEAARSVGMTLWQTMRRVVLPQALYVAVPGFGNTFVTVLKETSLGFALGLTETMGQAKLMAADTFKFLESFSAAALLYWGAAMIFGYMQILIERKMSKPYAKEM
ncbi:ABC transporter permease [Cohnella sp. CIP 111063]|uniref:amino acid ABC transporter permease n=1 Tax=unclassified Cohnella TaxID=2636738 RepID=UPI000B8BDDA9|nr:MULTISPECIES: amino acid ABC transporter permease [unclassified Cohnella]OXS55519.1 ABC transporter permease [Cohnella sp. CIP 111063]PRX66356.1 amino acid ABC transporter membrane protein (PAAT family) [Cohnella sp. SGD-V74]